MANEREQKLRNQREHNNHTIMKDDCTTADMKHSHVFVAEKQSCSTKDTVPPLKDETVHKRLKQKVRTYKEILLWYRYVHI